MFVRHAGPRRHDAVKGRADPALSEESHAAARRLGRGLAAFRRGHRSGLSLNDTAHRRDRPW